LGDGGFDEFTELAEQVLAEFLERGIAGAIAAEFGESFGEFVLGVLSERLAYSQADAVCACPPGMLVGVVILGVAAICRLPHA